jgi:hypothetical protein
MQNKDTTINFIDEATHQEACIIVRMTTEGVAVCMSLRKNGDIEAIMKKEDAKKLVDALKEILD